MHEDVNEVLQLRKESSGVKISFGLLLGQDWDNRVTRPQNRMIKMPLFRFIAAVRRILLVNRFLTLDSNCVLLLVFAKDVTCD